MDTEHRAVAIVGLGATLPDAPDVATFWSNIKGGRYSISEVQPERWDPARYYDPDPRAPDKTYSTIGGWVKQWDWDPFAWKLPIPPTVTERMDIAQRWAIGCTRAALADYGYPGRPLDTERTAVILGNAMGGELHYLTALKIFFPEFGRHLENAPSFAALPAELRAAIEAEAHHGLSGAYPEITEDSMPGELANCIAGRIANLYNFHGPNFVVDAACASAMAAMSAAIEGLVKGDFDAVLSGGIDRNMGASTFVKFCKIGALSATGTRPYADGADGFVMGEGSALFLLKRLADAERDGDRIYAVVRGLGGSSDGKGKGITAPNPVGQKLAIRRGWENAGLSPATAGFVEGHGTSTKVGDVVEVESLTEVFRAAGATACSVRLGSVKSNLGHLKGAAGAAGMLKATLALHDKVIPPSINCEQLNPNIDFGNSPFTVNTALEEWKTANGSPRRAGVSAFGFGGTNFHVVLEEHVPGLIGSRRTFAGADFEAPPADPARSAGNGSGVAAGSGGPAAKAPPGGIALAGAMTVDELKSKLTGLQRAAGEGEVPPRQPPLVSQLKSAQRVAIDFDDAADLAQKAGKAIAALESDQPKRWAVLASQGIFRGRGEAPPVAFLYTGQGSQYANMLADLRRDEPIVAAVFAEADRVMEPLIGRPLSDHIFVDPADASAMAAAEESLRQTTITQPAVLSVDTALTRLLAEYGVEPDMVMGHSLGEYGALVAAGALDFAHALEAVSARGREMARVSMGDNGAMAAVSAPIPLVEEVLAGIDGYVVIANINSTSQAVIGGETEAVNKAVAALDERGVRCVPLSVSHAFHTRIVAPASDGLSSVLRRLGLNRPRIPVVSNVTGEFYPTGPSAVEEIIDLLGRQVASPVQFVKGLDTLFDAGARVFVEVGPKRALTGFTQDVLGNRPGVLPLFTNHPRLGDAGSVNRCLAGLYAAGLGRGRVEVQARRPRIEVTPGGGRPVEAVRAADRPVEPATAPSGPVQVPAPAVTLPLQPTRSMPQTPLPAGPAAATPAPAAPAPTGPAASDSASRTFLEAARIFADFLERGMHDVARSAPAPSAAAPIAPAMGARPETRVVVTGVAVGLPGTPRVFDDANLERILRGDVMIGPVPQHARDRMANMHVTRLVKPANADPRFERIDDVADVIKLAGRGGEFDLSAEFGVSPERAEAFDACTRLAMAAGIDALRDAGIPLVRHYRTTTLGTQLPEGWRLPDALRDETGVIFASAFPGIDPLIEDVERYHEDLAIRQRLADLEAVRAGLAVDGNAAPTVLADVDRRIAGLRADLERHAFAFNRRFLFRVLAMGHSQFAEEIGARGPNTQVNSACATTTLALGVAEDWIRAGRCRRVIIVAGDDVTRDGMMDWFGAAFLASGAAATDEAVEDAALPFDRRRHGMIMGMGGAALVLEDAREPAQRGVRPICEVMGTVNANSAFHGSRLDIEHISGVMEKLVSDVEQRWGMRREQFAPETVFVSHETYTPARGGSASAEVHALRRVFGPHADDIVISNTKGFTGHAMAVGIEDVIAVRTLETGIVPPVPNLREIDPELGNLNLSKGGPHAVRFALRLGAGFGSQISMALLGWTPTPDGRRPAPDQLGFGYRVTDPAAFQAWLSAMSGYPAPDLEIDHRRLRIRDQGPPVRAAMPAAAAQPATAPVPSPAVSTTAVSSPAVRSPGAPAPAVVSADDVSSPAVPSTAAAPRAAPVAEPPATGLSPIQTEVLRIVSEQTGYPPDMLDMDLDLEADLGIDTVKQAETFAAIRQRWDIARDDNLKLRDYPTLNHVVQFVLERSPAAAAQAGTSAPPPAAASPLAAAPAAPAAPAAGADGDIAATVLRIVAEQTGYPPDMLDMDLDLEADLGIDTVKQAETFAAIRQEWDIPRDENLKLRDYPTLNHVVQFVLERRPAAPAPTPSAGPAAPSPAAASPAAPSGAAGSQEAVRQAVLRIVADQTGYPPDMLDMDLDLEADLGIDTVKQAETFAAIRQEWDIPRDENLKLRDYPTLEHVVHFVLDRMPAATGAATAESGLAGADGDGEDGAAAIAPESPATAGPTGSMDAANAVPRRVPGPVLRPPLDMCKPTGVELGDGAKVLVMMDRGGIGDVLVERLARLGVESIIVEDAVDAAALETIIDTWLDKGPIRGVYWLPALDPEPALQDMELADWREALRLRVKLLYAAMRKLYEPMKGPGTFLVAATRLGGLHGYDEAGAENPMGGAVTGFVKACARERPAVLSKVVDFETSRKTAALADILIDETLHDPGAVEIGIRDGRRYTIGLREMPPGDGTGGLPLGDYSVYVVTGAAGSIVSAIVADLATHGSGGTFHLLDLAAEPDPDDPDLARFHSDRDGLRRDIFERMKAAGQRATPAMVEKELARLERAAAALSAIRAVRAAGGSTHWHSVDLRDADAVRAVIEQVRESRDHIDLLVHAAGLEISRFLPDKEAAEYDLVFDVKADGWFNLMKAAADMPIGATVAFSSIAGRFGNGGQTDYSAANDLLCKCASSLRTHRPGTRGLAIDWTAWGGIGMASRGSIPRMMEAAGIDMLPPEAGIPVVRREVTSGADAPEVVIAKSLGIMLAELDETGGLDPDSLSDRPHGPMIGRAVRMGIHDGLVVETVLDPAAQPFLDDHRIDGTAVLPGVMGVEAFAELATLALPGFRIDAMEDIRFLAPFKFYRDEPRTVRLEARFEPAADGISADCRLIGMRNLPGQDRPQVTTHFAARVRLVEAASEPPQLERVQVPAAPTDEATTAADIYRVYFHGPAYRVLERAWSDDGSLIGRMNDDLPPNHRPPGLPLASAPRHVELCFQTAGLHGVAGDGTLGLPMSVARLRTFVKPAGPCVAVVRPRDGGGYDADVISADGTLCVRLDDYRTIALPGGAAEDAVEAIRAGMEGART